MISQFFLEMINYNNESEELEEISNMNEFEENKINKKPTFKLIKKKNKNKEKIQGDIDQECLNNINELLY